MTFESGSSGLKAQTSRKSISTMPNRVQILKQKFAQSVGLPFRDLLPESTIQYALTAENVTYRRRLFDPFITIWVFLSQVLDTDKSCHHAVSRVFSWRSLLKMQKFHQQTRVPIVKQEIACPKHCWSGYLDKSVRG